MSLQTNLSAKLDTSQLVTALLGGLNSASGNLTNVALPATGGQISDVQQIAGSVDSSGIAPIVGQVVESIGPLLESFPSAQEVMRPLTVGLDLMEESLVKVDLRKQLEDLSARLATLLEGPTNQGFIGILVQFADILKTAPESQKISALFTRLLETAGVEFPTCLPGFSDLGPALKGAVMTIGGLMNLESTLSEAERLTTLMAAQLDPAAVAMRREEVVSCFAGPTPLSQFLAGIDVNNSAQVASARSAIAACARKLRALVDLFSQGSAFGEATLLYLNMPTLQVKVAHAAGLVRDADLDPLERTLQSLQTCISGAVTVDLSGAPTFSLDNLISMIEGRVTEIAAGIESFDLSEFTDPLLAGIDKVTAIPRMLDAALAQVTVAVQAALGRLGEAIAALPIQSIGNAIRQVLQPLTQALEFIGSLVDTIKAALETAVVALKSGLSAAEATVDKFKQEIDALFNKAAEFIATLNLDQVLVKIAESIKALCELIEKAQMKPYFDTAVDVIDSTTTVVENVPFSLLPDSMEQEVVSALRPVKSVDLDAFKNQIESLLQIGPDGKFQLRPEIEKAVAGVQQKYDDLITELKRLDPHLALQQVDKELKKLADKIQTISPQVELQPVQAAIDGLRSAMTSFDLNATLQPLRDAFDNLIKEAEKYSPAALIAPLETKLDESREQLIEVTKLEEAAKHLDLLSSQATELLASLDPAQLEPLIQEALREALQLLNEFPEFQFAGGFGSLVTSLLTGMGLHVEPLAFNAVLAWLQGTPGAASLGDRSSKIAGSIAATRAAVASFDPAQLSASLVPEVQAMSAALARLPAGAARTSLETELSKVDLTNTLGNLARNRERYLASLVASEGVALNMSHTGLSEVDIKINSLQTTFAPLAPFKDLLHDFLARLGITGLEQGLGEVLRRIFAVATPERIAKILTPLYAALRGRILALIDAVLTPIKDGIQDLLDAVGKIDLTALREQIDSIFQSALEQIGNLHPDRLLGDVLTAFESVRTEVLGFNPLVDLTIALTELRETTTRILGKLNAGEIMATPLQIYDTLMGLFEQLDLNALLQPLFDQLDNIAKQVDEGLTGTVDSFGRLQDALPDTIGSTSLSASVSVSAG
ncbi:MAG TPA: hypothetical protein VEW46_01445 [Pyrinomonadaceae bacterium]|nr:hypothetical protein [Pyrinomonadaceae bacterium]